MRESSRAPQPKPAMLISYVVNRFVVLSSLARAASAHEASQDNLSSSLFRFVGIRASQLHIFSIAPSTLRPWFAKNGFLPCASLASTRPPRMNFPQHRYHSRQKKLSSLLPPFNPWNEYAAVHISLPPAHIRLRNARAFPLLPAALASVPIGIVSVRVRVRRGCLLCPQFHFGPRCSGVGSQTHRIPRHQLIGSYGCIQIEPCARMGSRNCSGVGDSSSGSPRGFYSSPPRVWRSSLEQRPGSTKERAILDRYHYGHGHSDMCACLTSILCSLISLIFVLH